MTRLEWKQKYENLNLKFAGTFIPELMDHIENQIQDLIKDYFGIKTQDEWKKHDAKYWEDKFNQEIYSMKKSKGGKNE